MPIDARIPLGVQPLQLPSPLEIYQTVQSIQGQREQVELRRLAAEEARERRAEKQTERAQQQALGERYAAAVSIGEDGTITLDKQKLFAGAPPALVPTLVEAAQKDEARMTALLKGTLDLDKSRREWLGGEGAEVVAAKGHPEAWDTVLRRARDVRAIDAATEARLRAVRDPAEILALAQAWVTRASGKPGEGFTLSPGQVRYGPTGELLATGPAKPPGGEDPFTLSPGSVRFSPTGERIAAVPAAPSSASGEPLVQVLENGVPVWRTRAQAVGQPAGGGAAARPATEGERKAAGFHGQMQQALATINALESQLTERDLYQIQSLPQEGITGALNRGVMSDTAKRYIQAFNQFTEARLRPVSGAAIAASEYERDRATYGKQYAETPTLAAQRQAARTQALEALRVMGGGAIGDAPASPDARTPPPGGGGGAPAMTYQDYLKSQPKRP